MKLIHCLIIMLCSFASMGQVIQPVKIGDVVPFIPAATIINHPVSSVSLADFKNKLVILDFWTTWCAPCIKMMPHFEALQKKFGGQLQFVLTTPQEKEKIKKFLALKQVTLPCFVEDKILPTYFPHNSVPHEIWIKEGRVVAITYAEDVTEENIKKVLNGEDPDLVEKKSNLDYDIVKPLLVSGNGGSSKDLLYHSVVTRYLDGIVGSGGQMTDHEGRFKIRVMNTSIAGLYLTAAKYLDPSFRFYNQVIIKAKQKEEIFPSENPHYTLSVRPSFYCYELIVPASEKAKAPGFMMDDLNRFFGLKYHITGTIEKIKTTCWVLRRMDNYQSISSRGGDSKIEQEGNFQVWQNATFSDFFYTISFLYQKQPYPFVDKTAIHGNVDIRLPVNLEDIDGLRSYLTKDKLSLTLEECETPLVVIKNNY
jgi:thiol-disulfide isomerase/thioredoxin